MQTYLILHINPESTDTILARYEARDWNEAMRFYEADNYTACYDDYRPAALLNIYAMDASEYARIARRERFERRMAQHNALRVGRLPQ